MKMHTLVGASALVVLVSAAQAQSINGTVKKIDAEQGKLTIDHGPIKNLDKIKFDADRVNGQITVTKLQKSK